MSAPSVIDFESLALRPFKASSQPDQPPLMFVNIAAGDAVITEEASYRLEVAHELASSLTCMTFAQGNSADLQAFAAAMALITGDAVELLRHAEGRRGAVDRFNRELNRLRHQFATVGESVELTAEQAPLAAQLRDRLSPAEREAAYSAAGVWIAEESPAERRGDAPETPQ